jgi:hypothetical protein
MHSRDAAPLAWVTNETNSFREKHSIKITKPNVLGVCVGWMGEEAGQLSGAPRL